MITLNQQTLQLEIRNMLELPELGTESPIRVLLDAAFKKHRRDNLSDPLINKGSGEYWPAEFFNLNRVGIFNEATADERKSILRDCANALLEEAYYIERLGMAFGAKMILLSSSVEEQMLYSLLLEEEATHLQILNPFIPEYLKKTPQQPFLNFLETILREGEMSSLIYLIQVILEGWGISHYNHMAHACLDTNLQARLKKIVQDEALHHGSGVVQFNHREITAKEKDAIFELLIKLFSMVQAGPQRIVQAIQRAKGDLSKKQRAQIFEELECEKETSKKIQELTHLILKHHSPDELNRLESCGVFRSLTADQCAEIAP